MRRPSFTNDTRTGAAYPRHTPTPDVATVDPVLTSDPVPGSEAEWT